MFGNKSEGVRGKIFYYPHWHDFERCIELPHTTRIL